MFYYLARVMNCHSCDHIVLCDTVLILPPIWGKQTAMLWGATWQGPHLKELTVIPEWQVARKGARDVFEGQ